VDREYDVAIPFQKNCKTYYLAHGECNRWYIQKITNIGKFGPKTDSGNWSTFYNILAPFEMNGKMFFYAASTKSNCWFIRELLQEGKMGEQTDSGIITQNDVRLGFFLKESLNCFSYYKWLMSITFSKKQKHNNILLFLLN
jgi:hypothetical protein